MYCKHTVEKSWAKGASASNVQTVQDAMRVELEHCFDKLDAHGNGFLTWDEFCHLAKRNGHVDNDHFNMLWITSTEHFEEKVGDDVNLKTRLTKTQFVNMLM